MRRLGSFLSCVPSSILTWTNNLCSMPLPYLRTMCKITPASTPLPIKCTVATPYGLGKVKSYRENDGMYKIALDHGATLYAHPSNCFLVKQRTQAELNETYNSMEKMRLLNLEVQCSELGLCYDPVQHKDVCTKCLLSQTPPSSEEEEVSGSTSMFSFNPFGSSSQKSTTGKRKGFVPKLKGGQEPCLACGNPTCKNHASKEFLKEHVIMCQSCQDLFYTSFEKNDFASVQEYLQKIPETYDRLFLMLQYSTQPELLEAVSKNLQSSTSRDNQVTLGTSSVGALSGAMGLAGAATLLTPFGAPLLVASFVTGTSSSIFSLGYSASKYASKDQPAMIANRIIALDGLIQSLFMSMQEMRQMLMDDPILSLSNSEATTAAQMMPLQDTFSDAIKLTRTTNTGMAITQAAGYSASGNVFQYLQMAPVIGSTFSAAMMVMDVHTAQATLEQMRRGNPSDKAERLDQIATQALKLPPTEHVEHECQQIQNLILIRQEMRREMDKKKTQSLKKKY